jgi:IS30 family transposase
MGSSRRSKRTAESVAAVARQAISRHTSKFVTLTLDNETEFHNYKQIEAANSVISYFTNPYHVWERDSHGHFNGLLRQYVLKGTSMKHLSHEECNRIALRLNTRPRRRIAWKTPKEVYAAAA